MPARKKGKIVRGDDAEEQTLVICIPPSHADLHWNPDRRTSLVWLDNRLPSKEHVCEQWNCTLNKFWAHCHRCSMCNDWVVGSQKVVLRASPEYVNLEWFEPRWTEEFTVFCQIFTGYCEAKYVRYNALFLICLGRCGAWHSSSNLGLL